MDFKKQEKSAFRFSIIGRFPCMTCFRQWYEHWDFKARFLKLTLNIADKSIHLQIKKNFGCKNIILSLIKSLLSTDCDIKNATIDLFDDQQQSKLKAGFIFRRTTCLEITSLHYPGKRKKQPIETKKRNILSGVFTSCCSQRIDTYLIFFSL